MPETGASIDDRLLPGISHQKALVRELAAGGTTVVGWKAGLGAPATRAALGLAAPLIGLLLDATEERTGTTVPIATWQRPLAEAEVAVRLGRDVAIDASPTDVLDAVDALAPAIKLVDLSPPPEDPAIVLAGNIFHRAWLTGPFASLDGPLELRGRTMTVRMHDEGPVVVEALEALTGPAGTVLAETARMSALIGRGLRAGDVVLLGSVIPPRAVVPGDTFRVTLGAAVVEVSLR